MGAADEDNTTRARIRDAAISRFAREGFRVPVRTIAADVGVSAALVIHHFGSKDALREECDAYVLEHSFMLKDGVLERGDAETLRALLSNLSAFDEPVAYLLRSLLDGGKAAAALLERTVKVSEKYLERGVAAGAIQPSRDPAARARYITYMSMGMLVTAFTAAQAADPEASDYAHVTRLLEQLALPHVELMTHGLVRDPAMLQALVEATAEPSAERSSEEGS